jgi:hypothetical protein
MEMTLVELPTEKLKLTFAGGSTYLVYNTEKKRFHEVGTWPPIVQKAICRKRKVCLKGFFIRAQGGHIKIIAAV